jgi:hypothetical protein
VPVPWLRNCTLNLLGKDCKIISSVPPLVCFFIVSFELEKEEKELP